MKFIIPLIFVLMGAALGAGVGLYFLPSYLGLNDQPSQETEDDVSKDEMRDDMAEADSKEVNSEFVELKGAFFVPMIAGNKTEGTIVLSLALETTEGSKEQVLSREPEIRDRFLSVLLTYAHAGGFSEAYVNSRDLKLIKTDLTHVGREVLGPVLLEVRITDLIKQVSQ